MFGKKLFGTFVQKLQKHKTTITMIVLSVAWFLIGWRVREFFLNEDILLVEQGRNIILNYYNGDTPSSKELTYAALRGMLYSIDDPRAVFYQPEIVARKHQDDQGRHAGTGMMGEMRDGGLEITYVNPGEPADQSGLQAGDIVVKVDDWELEEDTTYTEASLMIRGPEGSTVHLTVQRGDEILEFDVMRKAPMVVITRTIEPDIAYLYLQSFVSNAPDEMKQGLESLLASDPQGLIWDLRGNGGGALTATVGILDYFFSDEGVLFYAEEKSGVMTPFHGTSGGIATEIPLVVLIDGRSYSAPELAAATIAERDRGTLIGKPTYGKGTINITFPLLDGSAMQMTVARWVSPEQQWYGDRGVPPDIFLEDDEATAEDEVIECAVTLLRHPQEQLPPECGGIEQ
jgi:carboxyl-terminal processing protease